MNEKCKKLLAEKCPGLDPKCLSQMDYYLVGKECIEEISNILKQKEEERMAVRKYDEEYIRIGKKILENGVWVYNDRTRTNCLVIPAETAVYDMSDSDYFPLLTTKKMNIEPIAAELIGFIKGYDSAKLFREEGCKIWDANANESEHWLNNPNRKGEDDLGRIYGVQARRWRRPDGGTVDQLDECVKKIQQGIDDRRLIVTHWNPGELDQMALPPCHMMYMFMILDGYIHMTMVQRSCDYPLGVPYNIASYALLLRIIAGMGDLKPGKLTHVMHNIHVYENQLDLFKEQMSRIPKESPKIEVPKFKDLEDFCARATKKSFKVYNYNPDAQIKFPFSA